MAAAVVGLAFMTAVGCGSSSNDPERPRGEDGQSAQGETADRIGAAAAAQHVANPPEMKARLEIDWVTPLGAPALQTVSFADPLFGAMYDRLVARGPDNKTVEPYLAESWDAQPDKITFNIRGGAKCSDGTEVTPTVIKRSLDYVLAPETKSRFLAYVGKGPFTVEADDAAKTVTVRTETANNELLVAFTEATAGIVCPAAFDASEADLQKQAFGSGPFEIENVQPGRSVTLKRREGWTGPMGTTAEYLPPKLTFEVLEPAAGANLIATGGLDLTRALPSDLRRLEGNDDLLATQSPQTAAYHVIFNMAKEPYKSNKALRQGILTGIDRQSLLTAITGNDPNAALAKSIFGTGTDCAADLNAAIPTYNVEEAKTLLAGSGYHYEGEKLVDSGGKQLTLELIGNSTGMFTGPELLAEELRALGIDVKLRSMPTTQYTADFLAGTYDMLAHTPVSSLPAPTPSIVRTLTGPLTSDGGTNFLRVTDPKLDQMAVDARAATLDSRCESWKAFQEYYLSQYYSLPMGNPVGYWFSTGWDFAAFGTASFEAWSLAKRR